MANFPTSLDTLANPTPTTLRNQPGFSLAGAVSTLNDIAELLQAKAGISEAAAQDTPVANSVLASSTNGRSKWRPVATTDLAANAATRRALGYIAAADLRSGVALTANVPLDVIPTAQSFTLDVTNSVVLIGISGGASAGNASASAQFYTQVTIDGAFVAKLGMAWTASTGFCNPFAGSGMLAFSGFTAGSHTINVQVIGTLNGTFSCRAGGGFPAEFLSIWVTELKR